LGLQDEYEFLDLILFSSKAEKQAKVRPFRFEGWPLLATFGVRLS